MKYDRRAKFTRKPRFRSNPSVASIARNTDEPAGSGNSFCSRRVRTGRPRVQSELPCVSPPTEFTQWSIGRSTREAPSGGSPIWKAPVSSARVVVWDECVRSPKRVCPFARSTGSMSRGADLFRGKQEAVCVSRPYSLPRGGLQLSALVSSCIGKANRSIPIVPGTATSASPPTRCPVVNNASR